MFRFSFHSSRWIATASIAFAVLGASATRADAQTVEQAGAPFLGTCEANAAARGAYDRCALTMKHSKLERNGEVVGIETFLRPIGLTRFVAGDSARQFAHSYEQHTAWGSRLQVAGLVLALSPFVASRLHSCKTPVCPARSSAAHVNVGQIVGISFIAIGIPLQVHGRRQGYRAVSLYNASLGR